MLEIVRYLKQSETQEGVVLAEQEEIKQVYERYHDLLLVYCDSVKEPNTNPKVDDPGTFHMWGEPLRLIDSSKIIMEMSLTSDDIPLPKGWTKDSNTPLVVPDDVGINFTIDLRRRNALFPFIKARYRLLPNEIRWDVGRELNFAAITPASPTDCQKLLLLAGFFGKAQSGGDLPPGMRRI